MLDQPTEAYLGVETPFSLELTVRALQRRPANLVDVWEDDHYYRVFPTSDGNRLVSVEMMRPSEITQLKIKFFGGPVTAEAAQDIIQRLAFMLSINVDLSPFYELAKNDPALKDRIAALCGLKPPRFRTLFDTFVSTVIFQQISLDAGISVLGRLTESFGDKLIIGGRTYYAFPSAINIASASSLQLRSLGLSLRKADVLRDLAQRTVTGELNFLDLNKLSSPDAIDRLTKLPGIGRWSAEVVLLRGLGRLDVFPGGDSGARKNMTRLVGIEGTISPEQEETILARYGKYKGFLYFCALIWGGLQTGAFPHPSPASSC